MKKFLLLIPVLFKFGVDCSAQIIITNTDMPVAGDTIRMSTGMSFNGMDPAATGADYGWDYSKLTPSAQTIDTFLNINSTALVYSIFFANYSSNVSRSNLAERGASFNPLPGFSISEVFNFYYSSSSRYEQTGFGAALNGITIPTAYSPHDTIYHFPMSYDSVDSSYSSYSVALPNTFYYSSKGFRHNEADGWGSLTTPYGTFNALRVTTIINIQDSIYLDSLGFGLSIPEPQQIQYKWLGKGQGEPLLQINTTTGGVVTQIIYRDSVRANANAGIPSEETLMNGFIAYPNPSGSVQTIVYSLKEAADIKLEVYDMFSRKIITLADERQAAEKHIYTLNVSDDKFSSGIYLLELSVNGKSYFQKLLVAK